MALVGGGAALAQGVVDRQGREPAAGGGVDAGVAGPGDGEPAMSRPWVLAVEGGEDSDCGVALSSPVALGEVSYWRESYIT